MLLCYVYKPFNTIFYPVFLVILFVSDLWIHLDYSLLQEAGLLKLTRFDYVFCNIVILFHMFGESLSPLLPWVAFLSSFLIIHVKV